MKNLIALIISVGLLAGCSPTQVSINNCGDSVLEKTEKNIEGIITFDNDVDDYVISRAIPGTYDSVDIGIVCSLDESLKQDGLKIRFDGSYYKYEGDVSSPLAGTQYYYLSIENVKVLD